MQTVLAPAACQLRSPATCRHQAHSLLTDCTGDQRSEAVSYPCGSSPGLWRMEMHTRPSLYTAQQAQQPQSGHVGLQGTMPRPACLCCETTDLSSEACAPSPFGCHMSEVNLQVGGDCG